jgi:hypothetical protein
MIWMGMQSIGCAMPVSQKCTNPFLDEAPWLFTKWGQPTNLRRETGGWFYQCQTCQATWVGPNGDHCDWCHQRWLIEQEATRTALLLPEWLGWDQRYFRLPEGDQVVWEATRGYQGDFIGAWQRRIVRAYQNGDITKAELMSAGKRVAEWMTRKQLKP